jgi:CTP:molybdopterin cytidylyltransferase MocA
VNNPGVACVVLAAGRGSRYGMPKVNAEVAPGITFLHAIVATAREAGVSQVVAVIPENVEPPLHVEYVVNFESSSEQVESARMGLASLDDEMTGALLWPVDHPFVSAGTVRSLIAAAVESAAVAAVPVHAGRRGHPVYFSRGAWPALFDVRDGGARSVLRSLGTQVLEVPVRDEGCNVDIDTRTDLEQWQASRVG